MRKLLLAAAVAALVPLSGHAQTAGDLMKGAQNDTANVLNYGMGYDLQRFSPLTQINRDTVKHLVPVWNYSYDDNKSEESQPLVYQGRALRHDQRGDHGAERQDRRADLEVEDRVSRGNAAHRVLRHHQPRPGAV